MHWDSKLPEEFSGVFHIAQNGRPADIEAFTDLGHGDRFFRGKQKQGDGQDPFLLREPVGIKTSAADSGLNTLDLLPRTDKNQTGWLKIQYHARAGFGCVIGENSAIIADRTGTDMQQGREFLIGALAAGASADLLKKIALFFIHHETAPLFSAFRLYHTLIFLFRED